MTPQECCVLIPSLSPNERLSAYVKELLAADFGLVLVVDDGSAAEYQPIFDEIAGWERCAVLHHDVNKGKGAALRTGFAYIRDQTAQQGIITADSDGQHTVPDTLKLTAELGNQNEVLLGSRNFSGNNSNIPPKSRIGNRLTSWIFRVLYGHWLPDTQTGLRAFHRNLIDFLLSITGDRFEYEMNMLIQCTARNIPLRSITIETIYHDDNKSTHFHPIFDSWRVYKLLLGNFFRYSAASILSFLVDYAVLSLLMFWVFADSQYSFTYILGIQFSFRALVAAPIARLCSAPVNFLLNRDYVFQSGKDKGAAGRYIVLAVCSLVVTTIVFAFLDQFVTAYFLHILLKIIIDVAMYVVNYRIQKAWVFPQKKESAPAEGETK